MEISRRPQHEPARSLRERRRIRTRRTIQAHALRLFAEKGFQATTIEEIAAAAEVAPRTFFRYFPTKEEVVFWSEFPPMAGFVAMRPDDEPALEALHHGIVEALAAIWDQDGGRTLERLRLAFRTPALHPRMWQQQAHQAAELARILADRLERAPDALEVRAAAAAVAAAVVAAEEWQAQDGEGELGR